MTQNDKRDENNLIVHEEIQLQRALLISAYKGTAQQKAIYEEHLQELALLADTFGVQVAERVICPIRKYEAATFITEGKLQEMVQKSKDLAVDMVIFDDEISPSQQRNLEAVFGMPVLDRTEVILGVFDQRAQTKEARLQIELAQLRYEAPRLKRLWTHLSRQSGGGGGGRGGGYQKGEGEKQIEIDRRIIKRDIDQLQQELRAVASNREIQRSARQRSDIPVFSIIGYTNAGKSTLLNALTDAKVFVEDKLFATLDTTTRKFTLNNNQEILLVDTVGFIRKLPHLLVAAFKSTLEEAVQADILLHLIDVSHPMAVEQAQTTFEVLQELGAKDKPIITVLNKVDKGDFADRVHRFHLEYPKTVEISALNRTGFAELEEIMIQELSKQRSLVTLRIPQSEYAVVSEIIRLSNVIDQDYDENDVVLKVDLPKALAGKFQKYVITP
ncbi:MAG: GTPase HflX [Parachlamydiaceae bacterium]|nr:GTPase HflX [Parachlamydiaceae bacterium]